MGSNCARRLLQRSSSSVKTLLRFAARISPPSVASGPSGLSGLPSPASRLSRRHNAFSKSRRGFNGRRLPLELGCNRSLMPLHSVTASALLKSMLSSEVGRWGCLSEGFATPL